MKIKIKALSLIVLMATIRVNAQNPNFSWVAQVGGFAYKYAGSITTDKYGNSYSTGIFDGTTDFDPGAGTYTLTSPGGYYNYILKLDATGAFVWVKYFSTTDNLETFDIEVDESGGVYVLGTMDGTSNFDPGSTNYTLTSFGSNDVFIAKLSSSGTFLWARQFGGLGSTVYCEQTLAVDNLGNVFAAGSFDGVVDFNPGSATNTLVSNGNMDVFISKLDSQGNYLWANSVGGLQQDEALGLDIDLFKNVIVGGGFRSQVDFDPGSGITTRTAQGFNDAFLMKVDSLGNFQWVNSFGSTSGSLTDEVNNVAVSDDGVVLATGTYSGMVDFDPSAGSSTLSSLDVEIYISRFRPNGDFIWVKELSGPGFSWVSGIDLDFRGNIYTTGAINGSFDADPGSGTFTLSASGGYKCFISKLDSNGNYSWARTFADQGSGNSEPVAIKVDVNGNIFTTGHFSGNANDFDPDAGVLQLFTGGASDVFIHKLNQCLPPLPPKSSTAPFFLTICEGESTSLSVLANGSINWFSSNTGTLSLGIGSVFITPALSAGTFTYYADNTTCTVSPLRTSVTVTVNPRPSIQIVSGSQTTCAGETVTLTALGSSAANYFWNTGSSANFIVVSPVITTVYTATASLQGCSDTAATTQNVMNCVGIQDQGIQKQSLKVYPNPAKSYVIIKTEELVSCVIISDALGRQVISVRNDSKEKTMKVDIENLISGMYFLKTCQENNYTSARLMIE